MGLRYAVTGSQGQLGRCLLRSLAPDALAAAWGHHDLDIADASVVEHIFDGCEGGPPDVLVNAAAYNAVDACEGSGAAEAEGVNAVGPGLLAEACERAGVRLIHVSTDYVFDGCGEHPYTEDGEPAPASAYGRRTRNGEIRVVAASRGAWVVPPCWG